MSTTNEVGFSKAQLNFLEFARRVFEKEEYSFFKSEDLAKAGFVVPHDIPLETGMLIGINLFWTGNDCRVYTSVAELYNDSASTLIYSMGLFSWIQAARILYQTVGISEKVDRVRFVELVKAL